MRILHLRSKFSPGGGPEKVIISLVKKRDVARFVHAVSLLCGPRSDPESFLEQDATVRERLSYVPWMKTRLLVDGVLTLRKLLRSQQIDLLHCHDTRANLLGILAARGRGLPLVTTLHGWAEASQFYGWAADSPKAKFYNLVDRTLIRGFDKVIATSHAVRGRAVASGLASAKLATIPNGIDLGALCERVDAGAIREQFGIAEGDRLIVAVGRVSHEKGHRYLLEAAELVLQQYPRARFLIAGDGPLRDSLAALAGSTGLRDQFILAGFRSDIGALLSAADLFVLPSLTESCPLAVLEAMAYGKAVVATDVGGVREVVVDGATGRLVPVRDGRRLAKAILELLTDGTRLRALGEAGKAIVRTRFADTCMVQRTQQLYQDLLGGGLNAC